jgi:hypothetical protein
MPWDGIFDAWQISDEQALSRPSWATADLTDLFHPTELPMPQTAKRDIFPDVAAAEGAPEHSAVRVARDARGYSVEELSLACGLATNEIEDIENGKSADPSKIRRIASALQVPESALLSAAVPTRPAES